ncbi:4a-hydroxytetrahydrobiopterin dehydratase [Actinoplanes lutulentus]|uniref:VOC family protein n=1 Tax=Actinoplanes lutulentus TaxID=1287878 RepID=UPI0015EB7403|nr:VOC family protein [Actinoplanes lutulentus]MBB2944742.1 4a-hydroxytetrahydrobiopterin dehydratase [Actinoplanes lutulentus]
MERILSRGGASEAVGGHGWRFLLGTLRTSVSVGSLGVGLAVAAKAVEVCGGEADEHLRVDLRADRVEFVLESRRPVGVTARDVELAHRITAAARDLGLRTDPAAGVRSVQELEIAIDALDVGAIRPFWKAVLGYTDFGAETQPAETEPVETRPAETRPAETRPSETRPSETRPSETQPSETRPAQGEAGSGPLVDPVGQGPVVWFQQMTEPRPQRNRIHLDLCVPHDDASTRISAALRAGGRLLSDTRAPAFWVLADVEGNEICVTTWQGRD